MCSKALNNLPIQLQKNLHKDLCVCNNVLKIDIINAIINGAHTIEHIKTETYATEGNECCKQQIERLIEYLIVHPLLLSKTCQNVYK